MNPSDIETPQRSGSIAWRSGFWGAPKIHLLELKRRQTRAWRPSRRKRGRAWQGDRPVCLHLSPSRCRPCIDTGRHKQLLNIPPRSPVSSRQCPTVLPAAWTKGTGRSRRRTWIIMLPLSGTARMPIDSTNLIGFISQDGKPVRGFCGIFVCTPLHPSPSPPQEIPCVIVFPLSSMSLSDGSRGIISNPGSLNNSS